ncbi:MAG: Uncharacterised protein [Flavobacteriaceae bacterium]|nr:MAG: Uncharacterised protein [Flavobacteriaceae bacterium]
MKELSFSNNQELLSRLPNASVTYIPNFWSLQEADQIFSALQEETPWQHDPITVFGKTYMQPRLTALYGTDTKPYSYSGLTLHPHPFSKTLLEVLNRIQTVDSHPYNTVLLNLYRDGQDSNGWHADNEKELGPEPRIASASFGEARYFQIKHRRFKEHRYKILLEHGSLLIMGGVMQDHWLHQIAKTARPREARINLTFRKLI